jgi:hypothetical protein
MCAKVSGSPASIRLKACSKSVSAITAPQSGKLVLDLIKQLQQENMLNVYKRERGAKGSQRITSDYGIAK